MKSLTRVILFFKERQLLVAVILAVTAALVMTLVSIKIYDASDVSRLDQSLPGHESTRTNVTGADDEAKFDASGTITVQTMDEFQNLYTKNRVALNALSMFDGNVLSDDRLKLTTSE